MRKFIPANVRKSKPALTGFVAAGFVVSVSGCLSLEEDKERKIKQRQCTFQLELKKIRVKRKII
ncbi:hypothetical protein RSJ42_11025 [Methanosarcina hadiensis]|uniref:hypothetical protein n=1 Tax=Methanosarcina hadiensis TaxID=3078083 RepID=UPI003977C44F